MGCRQTVVAALLLAAALAACAATPATAERRVYIDWMPRHNFSGWAKLNGPFYKGDYLAFYHPDKKLDVVEVDKRGFDVCDTGNPIHRYPGGGTRRGTTFVLLSEAKSYYFTCSVRYFCPAGMRLDIPVQERRRDDTPGTAMVESSATSPVPGPRGNSEGERDGQGRGRSDHGVQGTKWADMESPRPGP
ncbi:unnamed protein product [Triticum turgidum subsp. durum]|uniref:Phytocyanin domain-containing protein n=1 Tax=Triticum turgidum subsp. durum TaxID=4567 RepID=A0A9R1AQZ7_TRITD|nr:unnamed protein product [Triticum turgidum subsp. durum]